MTVAAVKRTGPAPAKAAKPPPPAPVPAPSRRRNFTPLTPMRRETARRMRKLAAQVQESHPDLIVHQHLRDAASTLESGNEEGAERHLRAAIGKLTPQQLMKNGMHTDDLHIGAKQAMDGVHRQLLLVKDIADVAAKNQAAIRRDSYDDDSSSPPPVTSPVRSDPNAGYGPGALAQKPTVRQPPGNQALNAPARSSSGGSDPAVADPVGVQPRGSKQFANGIGLSAETGRLAATPAPRGKPGGPGLYRVKNNAHSPYLQQVVKALIRKGMDPGHAYAVAWNSLRKWSVKSKHPEVRAAAGGGLAMEKVAEARAHAHAATWDDVLLVLEFVGSESYVDLNWASWDAGHGSTAGQKAHDTASATAKATAARDEAAKVHSLAGLSESKFPGTGKPIHDAADAFARNDPQAAGDRLQEAQRAIQQHPRIKAEASQRKPRSPADNDASALNSQIKTHQGTAAQMIGSQFSVTWADVDRAIELAAASPPPYNPAQPRVPAGQAGGGQFGAGQQQAAGAKSLGSKTASASAKATMAKKAQAKQGFLQQAAYARQQADKLIAQRKALQAQLASASGKTSSGQAGSTTSAGSSTTASSAPAASTTASSTAAATPASTTAATPAAPASSAPAPSAAQLTTAIAGLTKQIAAYQNAYKQAMAKAAAVK